MTGKCMCGKPVLAKHLCRACYDRALRARDAAYAQRQRESCKRWREANRDRVNETRRKRHSKRAPEEKTHTHTHVQKTYDLTPEQYAEALARGCRLCESQDKLRVDHCHETQRVRGILCHPCNVRLGFVEKKFEWFDRALDYLRVQFP